MKNFEQTKFALKQETPGLKNYYKSIKANQAHNPGYGTKHFIELPMMAAIVGFTGSGKTNTLMNLIDAFKGTFQKFVFCTMNFESDPLYVKFRDRMEKLADKYEEDLDSFIQVFDGGEVPEVEDIEEGPTLIVFDDLQGEKKSNEAAAKFYKYGRRKEFSCVYLGQSYMDIPIFIRKQLKYLIIKRVNQIDDLKRILTKYGLGQYKGRLGAIYDNCTADFTHCMMLDLLQCNIYKDFDKKIE